MKITQQQKNKLQDVVQKYGLNFMVLFGSQANDKARDDSDLDIAVKGRADFGELFNDLSRVFDGYNVDLRFLQSTEPVFLYDVFMRGEFLAGNEIGFLNYKSFAYKNYIDSESLFALQDRMIARRQRKLNHDQ